MDFIREHKVKISVGVLILFIFLMMSANVSRWRAERNAPQTEIETEEGYIPETEGIEYGENEIEYLMSRQDALQRKYGDLPEGFIWDMDGNLRSIGDPNKSAEESLYAYLNAISSLDLSTIQRYSRNSYVVKRYDNFFNSGEVDPDYKTQFIRNMYRECMLSLQINSVLSSSVFAENKVVFTVEAQILDLTSKEFWKDDKWTIYDNLHVYSLESDSTKADMYLYDYILNYYRSDKAQLRTAVFDVTLERYSDMNSGWLVSIDSDIDDACVYRDGTLVVSYIKEMYNNEAVPKYEKEEDAARESELSSGDDNGAIIDYNQNYYDNEGNLVDSSGNRINEDGTPYTEEDTESTSYGDGGDDSDISDMPDWTTF